MTPTPIGLPTYVVTRPEDHLLLTVEFAGFTAASTPDDPPVMLAGALAYLVVTFGPQATYEQRLSGAASWRAGGLAGSDPAGPSGIALKVPAGTVVPLTTEGILTAMAALPVWVDTTGAARATAVEMPAGLVLAPTPAVAGDPVTLTHPIGLRTAADPPETTALWQTEVRAASGLQALPWEALGNIEPSGDLPEMASGPLFYGQRDAIVAAVRESEDRGATVLPTVDRMRLSALGGTLTAHGTWTHDGGSDAGLTTTWQHDLALGRDRRVQYTQRGVLLPFGHAAVLVEVAERAVESDGSGGVALIRTHTTVLVEPIRDYVAGAPGLGYGFPFDRAEVLTTTIVGLDPVDLAGNPPRGVLTRDGGTPVPVPVRLAGGQGPVDVTVSMTFVGPQTDGLDLQNPTTPSSGRRTPPPYHPPRDYPQDVPGVPADFQVVLTTPRIAVPAVPIDLVRAAVSKPSDVHLVHGITVQTLVDAAGAAEDPASYVPRISALRVDLPAVRTLLPPGAPSMVDATLSAELAAVGEQAGSVLSDLRVADPLPGADPRLILDFAKDPRRSGALISPSLVADTVSRELGPSATALLSAAADLPVTQTVRELFGQASLLGMSLVDLLPATMAGLPVPTILQLARTAQDVAAGKPPPVTLSWVGLKPVGKDSFLTAPDGRDTTLDLTATVSSDASWVNCVLSDFALSIPDKDNALLQVRFESLTFRAEQGKPPSLKPAGVSAHFGGDLDFIAMLEKAVDFGDAGQSVQVDAGGITASYALSVPQVSAGVVSLRNIDFGASAVVPFTGAPVSLALHFATRDNPFTAAVLAFGGGGYVDLLVDSTGMRRFEGSLDFGAQIAVDFVIAAGEVHAFGGVRFLAELTTAGTDIHATAFLRFGGSLQVLGVVTVSIELSLELTYADDGDHSTLTGRATLVIDVDLTIWSDSVEIDSGEWVIAGGRGDGHAVGALGAGPDQLAGWRTYWAAFAR